MVTLAGRLADGVVTDHGGPQVPGARGDPRPPPGGGYLASINASRGCAFVVSVTKQVDSARRFADAPGRSTSMPIRCTSGFWKSRGSIGSGMSRSSAKVKMVAAGLDALARSGGVTDLVASIPVLETDTGAYAADLPVPRRSWPRIYTRHPAPLPLDSSDCVVVVGMGVITPRGHRRRCPMGGRRSRPSGDHKRVRRLAARRVRHGRARRRDCSRTDTGNMTIAARRASESGWSTSVSWLQRRPCWMPGISRWSVSPDRWGVVVAGCAGGRGAETWYRRLLGGESADPGSAPFSRRRRHWRMPSVRPSASRALVCLSTRRAQPAPTRSVMGQI